MTAGERRKARAWVERLRTDGGTDLIPAIGEALRPLRPDTPRQVVVVTDGLIGFEAEAVRAIRDGLPAGSRLHSVGVGAATNRAFLAPAARAGRGVEVIVDLDEPSGLAVQKIVAATGEPVVVDITLEGTALLDEPSHVHDLLSASPSLIPVRLHPDGGMLIVRGRTADGSWEQHLQVPATVPGEGPPTISARWARERIEELELDLACGGDRQEIDCRIEKVAREHSVSSRMTSWVAVAEEPSVDPRDPVRIERIPQVLPYGMSVEGLGLIGPTSSLGQFAAAPAPDFLAFRSDDVRFSPKPIERRGMRDSTLPELAAQLGQRLERRSEIAQQRAETLRRFAKDIWLASGEFRDWRVSGGYEDAVAAGRSLVDRLTRLKEALYEIGDSGSV